jgi:RNA polymerase sigma-70 factor (ECF subfamily)
VMTDRPLASPATPPGDGDTDAAGLRDFTRHRDLLFTVAYEITGSVADAEDVVSDSWLRWARLEPAARAGIIHPRAYLVRIVTRQALNRLRARSRLQEDYVGPWLPEPLLTAPDVADDVVLAESVSMAMMLVVESLSPDERAVFLLHEVFGFGHEEISEAIGKAPATVRQIAHRARSHVQARKPRFRQDAATREQVTQRFLEAAATGDLQALMDVLAPDVVLLSDGGGKVKAALNPVHTADRVARLLLGLVSKAGTITARPAVVNGHPGALIFIDGQLDTAASFDIANDAVSGVYLTRNPDKLAAVDVERSVTR